MATPTNTCYFGVEHNKCHYVVKHNKCHYGVEHNKCHYGRRLTLFISFLLLHTKLLLTWCTSVWNL